MCTIAPRRDCWLKHAYVRVEPSNYVILPAHSPRYAVTSHSRSSAQVEINTPRNVHLRRATFIYGALRSFTSRFRAFDLIPLAISKQLLSRICPLSQFFTYLALVFIVSAFRLSIFFDQLYGPKADRCMDRHVFACEVYAGQRHHTQDYCR